MKRILSMALFAVCFFACSMASASGYPDYLGGDRNLLLSGGHMGIGWYVDKSSLKHPVCEGKDVRAHRIIRCS